MNSKHDELRTKLQGETGTADWSLLASHGRSDHLIIVRSDVELLEAAVAVASNNAERVAGWIEEGLLSKPDAALQSEFSKAESVFFQFIVVAPFVMAQQIKLSS